MFRVVNGRRPRLPSRILSQVIDEKGIVVRTLIICALLAFVTACGSDSPVAPTEPDEPNAAGCSPVRAAVFSATIAGSSFRAGDTLPIGGLLASVETIGGISIFAITGNSCEDNSLTFAVPAVVGTHSVGDISGGNAEYTEGWLFTSLR